MPVKIDKSVEAEIKAMKLDSLMRRYIELSYDMAAHGASGMDKAVKGLQEQRDRVETAYETIEAM